MAAYSARWRAAFHLIAGSSPADGRQPPKLGVDRSQAQPAAGGAHVGDVTHPGDIRLRRCELPIQHVGGHGEVVAVVGGVDELAFPLGAQLFGLHQRSTPVAADVHALLPECCADAPAAIAAAAGLKDSLHVHAVTAGYWRSGGSLSSRIEARAADLQHAAQLLDRGLPRPLGDQHAFFTHGGMGYAKEYHEERYLREAWIPRLAPVSPQLILCFIAEKILGLPKSY